MNLLIAMVAKGKQREKEAEQSQKYLANRTSWFYLEFA